MLRTGILFALLAFHLPAKQPAIAYQRLFGGAGTDAPTSVTTDLQGNVIVAGTTASVDFPPAPLQVRAADSQAFQSRAVGSAERVTAIAFSTDGSAGYAAAGTLFGTDNVLYRSLDGGHIWTPASAPPAYSASLLVVDPSTSSTVYAASLLDLYKSTDSGDTWVKLPYPGANNYSPSRLTIDPSDSRRLFLIVGFLPSRVYRSGDGGLTWRQLSTALPYNANVIAIDPNQPDTVYSAGSFENVFRSLDGGDTWTQLLPGVTPSFLYAKVTVDPFSVLYAATAAGIYRSTDRGNSYTRIPAPGGGSVVDFEIDPLDASHFIVSTNRAGLGCLYESRDRGAGWVALDPGFGLPYSVTVRGSSLFLLSAPARRVVVTKWDSLRGSIQWSAHLGPAQTAAAPKVVADRNGFIYVSGGAPPTVSKLSPDGAQLVWSVSIGGGATAGVYRGLTTLSDLQVDDSGNVYIAGSSCSTDFPANEIGIAGVPVASYTLACGSSPGGAFVAKLNQDGTTAIYGASLRGADGAASLALDSSGGVYLAGTLANRTGPAINGPVPRGPSYLMRISPQLDKIESLAVLDAGASATSIALAPGGGLIVTGATSKSLAPEFTAAFRPSPLRTCSQDSAEAYVLRTAADLRFTAFSFLGNGCDEGASVRADRQGNIWVSGSSAQGPARGFAAELTPDAGALLFSTRFDFPPQLTVSRENTVFLVSPASPDGALLTRIDH